MQDVDVSEIFLQEATELMEQLELALLDLESRPNDQTLIDSAFRALHTIKGSGAMFGFDRVSAFIHDFETAFDRIRKGQALASPALIKVALEAKDYIRTLIEAADSADPADGVRILSDLAATTRSDSAIIPVATVSAVNADPIMQGPTSWHLDIAFNTDLLLSGSDPLLLFDEIRDLGPCTISADTTNVPDLAALDPETLHLTWQVDVTTEAPRRAFDEVFMFVLDDMRLDISSSAAGACPAEETAEASVSKEIAIETSAPIALVPPTAVLHEKPVEIVAAVSRSAPKEAATIRVPAERLDEMMDRVGELVIVQARLSQIASGTAGDDAIKSVSEDIARLTSALREAMMGVRMVPIGSLFTRFRRLLHDLSQQLGKEIELVTLGDDTEMDKTMIERLADPLVHVIRNAADHGLEDAATRVAAGKTPSGRITLSARHSGGEVLVSIKDNGRGLNTQRIRRKAESLGLIAPGAVLSDNDINALIFAPGFSTAQEVSALSGRGVGMDVVRKTIETMRGSIDLATEEGVGTTLTLRLPLTLAIIEGLLVRVAETRYVIPLTAVEECVELTNFDDARSERRSFLNLRGDLIPFLRLRELFDEAGHPDVFQKIVIVSNGETRIGLVVDQIIGSHQTVIKSLSRLHADVSTFSGATILGDGTVALILDIQHAVALGQSIEARHKLQQLECA